MRPLPPEREPAEFLPERAPNHPWHYVYEHMEMAAFRELAVCGKCGAVVGKPQIPWHEDWHRNLGQ